MHRYLYIKMSIASRLRLHQGILNCLHAKTYFIGVILIFLYRYLYIGLYPVIIFQYLKLHRKPCSRIWGYACKRIFYVLGIIIFCHQYVYIEYRISDTWHGVKSEVLGYSLANMYSDPLLARVENDPGRSRTWHTRAREQWWSLPMAMRYFIISFEARAYTSVCTQGALAPSSHATILCPHIAD